MEASESTSRQNEAEIYEKKIEKVMNASQTYLVVATLIVTVTFAAGLTLPGGFDNDPNSTNKGTAILLRKPAFCAFVVTDVIAFACSTGTMLIYYAMTDVRLGKQNNRQLFLLLNELYIVTGFLQCLAIVAVVIAFVTGMYATLAHSAALAIIICIIGCSYFLVFLWVFFRLVQHETVGRSSAV